MMDDDRCCACNRLAYHNPGEHTILLDGSYLCPACERMMERDPTRADERHIAQLESEIRALRDIA